MARTVSIPDDIHALIIDKQLEIRRKYKISVRISDIIALIVKNNINKIGEYLGLKSEIEDTGNGIGAKQEIKQDIRGIGEISGKDVETKQDITEIEMKT